MYDLFKKTCQQTEKSAVKDGVYRNVLCRAFNLSFYRPKRMFVLNVKNTTMELKKKRLFWNRIQTTHWKQKEGKNGEWFGESKCIIRSVVSCSYCWLLECIEYSLKQCIYFALCKIINCIQFYCLQSNSNDRNCMWWDGTKGCRGANHIGSLNYLYLREYLPTTAKSITVTSDSTMSQNRNQFVTNMMLLAVQLFKNVVKIEHKSLEPECTEIVDSMHAAIDSIKRNLEICVPSGWSINMQMTRRKNT